MKKMILLAPIVALGLSGCATVQRTQTAVTRAVDMLEGVTATVDTVLNRPGPLANTQGDENLIRSAYTRFDQGLDLIRALQPRRNSPVALRVRQGVGIVLRTLHAAYEAQKIGNAPTVRQALGQARTALADLTNAVQRSN